MEFCNQGEKLDEKYIHKGLVKAFQAISSRPQAFEISPEEYNAFLRGLTPSGELEVVAWAGYYETDPLPDGQVFALLISQSDNSVYWGPADGFLKEHVLECKVKEYSIDKGILTFSSAGKDVTLSFLRDYDEGEDKIHTIDIKVRLFLTRVRYKLISYRWTQVSVGGSEARAVRSIPITHRLLKKASAKYRSAKYSLAVAEYSPTVAPEASFDFAKVLPFIAIVISSIALITVCMNNLCPKWPQRLRRALGLSAEASRMVAYTAEEGEALIERAAKSEKDVDWHSAFTGTTGDVEGDTEWKEKLIKLTPEELKNEETPKNLKGDLEDLVRRKLTPRVEFFVKMTVKAGAGGMLRKQFNDKDVIDDPSRQKLIADKGGMTKRVSDSCTEAKVTDAIFSLGKPDKETNLDAFDHLVQAYVAEEKAKRAGDAMSELDRKLEELHETQDAEQKKQGELQREIDKSNRTQEEMNSDLVTLKRKLADEKKKDPNDAGEIERLGKLIESKEGEMTREKERKTNLNSDIEKSKEEFKRNEGTKKATETDKDARKGESEKEQKEKVDRMKDWKKRCWEHEK